MRAEKSVGSCRYPVHNSPTGHSRNVVGDGDLYDTVNDGSTAASRCIIGARRNVVEGAVGACNDLTPGIDRIRAAT